LHLHWQRGCAALSDAIGPLTDADFHRGITIRGQPLSVHDALHRSRAHVSYHVGQIVYLAHAHCGATWAYLSIPPGESATYNAAPTHETPREHISRLTGDAPGSVATRSSV